MREIIKDKMHSVAGNAKTLHKSGSVQFNVIAVSIMEALPYIKDSLPQLQPYVTPEFYKTAFIVLAVANMIGHFFKPGK